MLLQTSEVCWYFCAELLVSVAVFPPGVSCCALFTVTLNAFLWVFSWMFSTVLFVCVCVIFCCCFCVQCVCAPPVFLCGSVYSMDQSWWGASSFSLCLCVCVCVCVRERRTEREWVKNYRQQLTFYFSFHKVAQLSLKDKTHTITVCLTHKHTYMH